MAQIGVFDVVGPVMAGPSSSHTAGAVLIGGMAASLLGEPLARARFVLYGSFARTYAGHGTDKALLAGALGLAPDDLGIRDAPGIAATRGVSFDFVVNTEETPEHPNTADVELWGTGGRHVSVRGVSLGGGRMRLTRIDGADVGISGDYPTLLVTHLDVAGVIAGVTSVLGDEGANIAFMSVFRERKGDIAHTVIELDEPLPARAVERIAAGESVLGALQVGKRRTA